MIVSGRSSTYTGTEVSASVGLGVLPNGGFGIVLGLDIHAPALDKETAEAIVAKAHEVCPYSQCPTRAMSRSR